MHERRNINRRKNTQYVSDKSLKGNSTEFTHQSLLMGPIEHCCKNVLHKAFEVPEGPSKIRKNMSSVLTGVKKDIHTYPILFQHFYYFHNLLGYAIVDCFRLQKDCAMVKGL